MLNLNILEFLRKEATERFLRYVKVGTGSDENYDGGAIRFADNPDLVLSPEQSPELLDFVGESIITAAGTTLLGADDKAGLAKIMAALAAFEKYPEMSHPELRIVFTPDEELGRGANKIDIQRLGTYARYWKNTLRWSQRRKRLFRPRGLR